MVRTALAILILAAWSVAALAAPAAERWPRWEAHDEASRAAVDHAAWDALLKQHVIARADGINRVAYARFGDAGRAALTEYLDALQAVEVRRLARAEQRAFWINLYNAATVRVVLDHYPVESILKIAISPGLFSKGPWGKKLLKVEGEPLSLDDIEHRILRPIWRDPRTHYAVNCASLGCPNLLPRAFSAAQLDAQLDAAARAYVNHPRGATVEDGKLRVSSLYVWYQADFGGDEAGVIEHLKRYADAGLKEKLGRIRGIDDDVYDWSLNDAKQGNS